VILKETGYEGVSLMITCDYKGP